MELIIQVLIVFIVINCVLKLSFWKGWQAAIFAVVCAIFVIAVYPYSILQSKTQVQDYLANSQTLQNMAVLITIESAICFAFCYAALRDMFGKTVKWWVWPLYWYPSLLIFPVLFYMLTQAIFCFPGVNFSLTTYLTAASVVVLMSAFSLLVKRFFPEKELRLEIHFLTSLFVCIIGLLTTVDAHITYAAAEGMVDPKGMIFSLLLFVGGFLLGWGLDKIKWKIIQKRNHKQ